APGCCGSAVTFCCLDPMRSAGQDNCLAVEKWCLPKLLFSYSSRAAVPRVMWARLTSLILTSLPDLCGKHLRTAGTVTLASGCGGRLDLVHDPHLAGLAERIGVFAEVFLRQRVDMGIRALLHALSDAAAYLDVAVGVVGVHDCQRDRRPRSQGARLDPALGRV